MQRDCIPPVKRIELTALHGRYDTGKDWTARQVLGASDVRGIGPSRTLIAERVDSAAMLEPINAEQVSSQWP